MREILYTAWNRLEFTQVTFGLLLENTDWKLVDRVVIYDDGSTDGTREWLRDAITTCPLPIEIELRETNFRSSLKTLVDYVSRLDADVDEFAKVDSDIGLPPGWLQTMVDVLERSPELELLGMEAGRTGHPGSASGLGKTWIGAPGYEEARYIGGVGLMRASAFRLRRAPVPRGQFFGFTEWQDRQLVRTGWVCPDLMVPQLDRVPMEPYTTWSVDYVKSGWTRPWPCMDVRWSAPYFDWLPELEEAAA